MNNLKAIRQKKNLTQKDIAEHIGMAPRAYSRYESEQEKRVPNVNTAIRIADILGVADLRQLWPAK